MEVDKLSSVGCLIVLSLARLQTIYHHNLMNLRCLTRSYRIVNVELSSMSNLILPEQPRLLGRIC
jgi:hypothetical protein